VNTTSPTVVFGATGRGLIDNNVFFCVLIFCASCFSSGRDHVYEFSLPYRPATIFSLLFYVERHTHRCRRLSFLIYQFRYNRFLFLFFSYPIIIFSSNRCRSYGPIPPPPPLIVYDFQQSLSIYTEEKQKKTTTLFAYFFFIRNVVVLQT
jgi:hypothetical protein